MPFLRFTRDRRGYETTALVHSSRRQGRNRSRILYWFRGPVDVKVGRSPIDEDAIRLIEEHHPNVSFDWPRILGGHDEEREEAPPVKPPPRDRSAGSRRGRSRPEAGARPGARAPEEGPGLKAGTYDPLEGRVPTAVTDTGGSGLQAGTTSLDEESEPAAEPPPRTTAAHESFSPEDLARLSARYAAVRARIDQDVEDPARAEALREIAEALNPDCWVTPEDVRLALERYEQVYRELREALGPRHKRPASPTSAGPGEPDAS